MLALTLIISASPASAQVGGTITRTAVSQNLAYKAAVNKIIVIFLQIPQWQTADGTMKFTATNYSINQGCNTLFGTYTVDGDKMTLSEPASTMMACAPSLMDKDQAMAKNLSQVKEMHFKDGKMIMSGDKTIVTFTPKVILNTGK